MLLGSVADIDQALALWCVWFIGDQSSSSPKKVLQVQKNKNTRKKKKKVVFFKKRKETIKQLHPSRYEQNQT